MEIKAIKRNTVGTGSSNHDRREEKIPAVIYGRGIDSIPVLLDEKEITTILKTQGDSAIFDVAVEGGRTGQVYIKEVQRHSLKNQILHVSMQTLEAGQKLTVNVPVVLENTENIKVGILEQTLYEIAVETVADKVPDEFTVDAGSLEIGDTLTVADLGTLPDVEILEETDTLLATVSAPRVEEEPTEEAAAEPEVIGEADTTQ
ncbi:50S ribosomal protein L25 [Desemzia sp. RIT804]|uniref:50S ribosomal protein L25 n=1 Tax=Desemzia sp. RIT 804 TaxID=2810209 RepID=UPI001950BDBD|nr:50S ribosomal protein L25 [Desemzia sp. RIT 804]MBM6614676.1 50S ribosomal protein L25 [Desemzia sp. RIT 804]